MIRIFVCILLCLSSLFLMSQNVKFEAYASQNEIAVNNTFTVTFSVNTSGNNLKLPDFKGFSIIAGPSTITSKRIVNGVTTENNSSKLTLLATEEGTFTIPPAQITVKGNVYKTNTLKIQVVKGSELGSIGEGGKTFLQMETQDTIAYVGQRVVLKYMLYTKEDIANLNLLSQDDFSGFHVVTEESPRGYVKVKVGSEEYYSRTLLTYYLFPQQTGVFEIDPYSLKVAKPIKNGRVNFFGQRETKGEIIASNTTKIVVKDLPSGAPESFSGGVGKFVMDATILNKSYTTDDAIHMEMRINGTGDQKFWSAPKQPRIDDIEYYDPKINNEQWIKTQWGNATHKTVEYQMVPNKKGEYIFKPEFTYFDVDSMDYVTLKSGPFHVSVKQGEIKEIRTGLDEELPSDDESTESIKLMWILLPLTLLGVLGWVFLNKRQPKEEEEIDHEEVRKNKAKALAIHSLSRAKFHIDQRNEKEFYTEISLALNKYLGDKFNILSKERTLDNVSVVLNNHNIDDHKIKKYTEIMKKIELAIYAQMGAEDMQKTYDSSINLIQSMED